MSNRKERIGEAFRDAYCRMFDKPRDRVSVRVGRHDRCVIELPGESCFGAVLLYGDGGYFVTGTILRGGVRETSFYCLYEPKKKART